MQLVAYGAQDLFLTGNPQITFFKIVYRRYTNFSMETIIQAVSGTSITSSSNASGTVTVAKTGDLLHGVYVQAENTNDTTPIINGSKIVSDVTVRIGGNNLSKMYSEWMNVWNELTTYESKAAGLKSMIGDIGAVGINGNSNQTVQIPLQFWFCRNPGLALPLISLQYTEVKFLFTWGTNEEICGTGATTGASCNVFCDYIYLDTAERRRFAQISHEYLIEQVQRLQPPTATAAAFNLNGFNHPIKEIFWTQTQAEAKLMDAALPVKVGMTLNGHTRFSSQNREFFQIRQPYQYHTAIPRQNLPPASSTHSIQTLTRKVASSTSANIDSGIMLLPANSLILDCTVKVVDTALTFPNGNVGVSFGIGTAGDTTLTGALDPNSFIDTSTTIAVGVGNSTSTELNTKLGGATAIAFTPGSGDFSSQTEIHGRVVSSAGNFTAGSVLFMVKYIRTQDFMEARTSNMTNVINVYSFALNPEEHQPSGSCNFSRLETAQLTFSGAGTKIQQIYGISYNVFKVSSGSAGLSYTS